MNRTFWLIVMGVLCGSGAAGASSDRDPATGLERKGDWELIRSHCVACHSARLITQQRGSREQWLSTIRWMQRTQNLWQFSAETEARILDYLAENYPPAETRRRAPVPRHLMPPNPYASE